ncbi:MAG TPA: LLM class flavin-dependent oxidoreductase [candidate division Zixibacteria bacterium]|nr:LLM class flavin-dependent oxidoreductase [candidate division Zixibacteria bacterium]
MARVGYALGYGKFTDVREMADVMRQAEERGFEMAFFSETIELMRDSVTSLAAIGLATRRLKLGSTQIVRLRGPVVMAQSLATLDELTGGRMTLAPGACTRSHALVHALPTDVGATPPEVLREYIESIRLLLTGEKVSYHGKYVRFDNVGLGWKPVRASIPLYVPATAAVGLRLAGEIGDGVVLNAVCSPEYTVNALKIVREAAERAGRDFSRFEVAQIINCSVEDDHKKALDAVRWEVATKLDPVQIKFIAGPKMRVGEPYIRKEDIPLFEKAYAAGGMEALIKAVPDSYVEGMTASGTPDEVKKRVQEYRDAGVKLPLLRPAAAHQTQRVMDLFAQS